MSGLDTPTRTAKLIYGRWGVQTPPKDLDWRYPIVRVTLLVLTSQSFALRFSKRRRIRVVVGEVGGSYTRVSVLE